MAMHFPPTVSQTLKGSSGVSFDMPSIPILGSVPAARVLRQIEANHVSSILNRLHFENWHANTLSEINTFHQNVV